MSIFDWILTVAILALICVAYCFIYDIAEYDDDCDD